MHSSAVQRIARYILCELAERARRYTGVFAGNGFYYIRFRM
jgi:hypothetical protein